jgi:anti-sigma B factor antagonist
MTQYRQLTLDEVGDVTVVHFREPRITGTVEIESLGQELYQLVEKDDRRRLVLNFSAVQGLSSAAFGKLISLNGRVKSHHGSIKLCNIQPQVLEVFRVCKLDHVFDICDDEDDALQSI